MVISINKNAKQKGFTLVELLVVIVVISILAALTVVAYNQIQSRASQSVASENAAQAYRKLAMYFVDNGSYPPNLQTVGINPNQGSNTYQYSYDNSTNPATFCVTATSNNYDFHIDNTDATASGACTGHVAGGVTYVTNFVPNPGAENNSTANWTFPNSTTAVASTDRAHTGTYSLKLTLPPNMSGTNVGAGPFRDATMPNILKANTVYSFSIWVYVPSGSVPMRISVQGAGVALRGTTSTTITSVTNQWTQVRDVITTSDSGSVTFYLLNHVVTPSTPTVVYVDDAMVVEGDHSCAFADPSSNPNWSWVGTANNSMSTGPCI